MASANQNDEDLKRQISELQAKFETVLKQTSGLQAHVASLEAKNQDLEQQVKTMSSQATAQDGKPAATQNGGKAGAAQQKPEESKIESGKANASKAKAVPETINPLSVSEKRSILKDIKTDQTPEGVLKYETVNQIYDAIPKFAAPKFLELTRKDRTERRKSRQNFQKYTDLWAENTTGLEKLIESSQREVLKELKVSDQTWSNTKSFYMQNSNHIFRMIGAGLNEKLKTNLKSSKTLSAEELKKILNAKLDYFNQEASNPNTISDKIKRPEKAAALVSNIVNDRIFEDFGVEEEDIDEALKKNASDADVQKAQLQLQQASTALVSKLLDALTVPNKKAIAKGVKVDYKDGKLTTGTISQICDFSLKFAAPKFIELTKRDRAERRAQRQDLQKYIAAWDKYATDFQDVIEAGQIEVLKKLDISEKTLEESDTYHMQQGNNEIIILYANLPHKLKANLAATKALSADELKKIMKAQAEYLGQEISNASKILEKTKSPEEAAPIIQNIVNDRIFEKFGVEEEDIDESMRQNITDSDVQKILNEQQGLLRKLAMVHLGNQGKN